MIFQHTWEKLLLGAKTQTARRAKSLEFHTPPESYVEGDDIVYKPSGVWRWVNGKVGTKFVPVYVEGKTYAVQPGRGMKTVARIQLTSVYPVDVRDYTADDIYREGFDSYEAFMRVWCKMHDKKATQFDRDSLMGRDVEWYSAWVLRFEVVK